MADQIDVRVGAQIAEFAAAMKQIEQQVDGLGQTFKSLAGIFTGVSEALATVFAVEKIAHWSEQIAEAGQRVVEMSHELGMTVESVSQLNVAFQAMGMSSESAGMALIRLERNMQMAQSGGKQQEAAFIALGISMSELKDLSPDELLNRMAETFSKTEDGPNKTAIAIALLGRQGAAMIPFLDRGIAGLEEFKRIGQETGSVLTTEMAEGMEQTAIGMNTFDLAGKGVGITLFEAVKPALDLVISNLIDLVEGFNNSIKEGGALHVIFTGLVNVINGLLAGLIGLKVAFQIVWDIVSTGARQAVIGIMTFLEVWNRLQNLDLAGAKEAAKRGFEQWTDEAKRATDKIISDTTKAQAELAKLFSGEGQTFVAGEHKPTEQMPGMDKSGENRMQQWKSELDQKRDAEGAFREFSKQQEVAYWQEKLAEIEGGTNKDEKLQMQVMHEISAAKRAEGAQEMAAANEVFKLKMDLAKNDEAEQKQIMNAKVATALAAYGTDSKQYQATVLEKQKLDEQWVKTHMQLQEQAAKGEEAAGLSGLAMAEEHAKALFDLGKMTQAQLTQSERESADAKLAIELDYLNKKRAAQAAGNDSPVNIAATDQAIAAAKQAHASKMVAIDDEAAKKTAFVWSGAVDSITNSFDQMLTGVLRGTQTWQQAMSKLFSNLAVSFITDIAKMTIQWAAFELGLKAQNPFEPFMAGISKTVASFTGGETTMTAAKETSTATQTTTQATATAANMAENKVAAMSDIAAWAAAAAVEAMSSVASIPFVGWIMAPGVGAATYAEAISYEGLAALDTGTNYVPQDMVALLHKGEQVVPEKFNPAAGGMGGGGDLHVHFNVSAIDGVSVSNMLKTQSGTITAMLARAARDNSSNLKPVRA